jgi:hypothetical protein
MNASVQIKMQKYYQKMLCVEKLINSKKLDFPCASAAIIGMIQDVAGRNALGWELALSLRGLVTTKGLMRASQKYVVPEGEGVGKKTEIDAVGALLQLGLLFQVDATHGKGDWRDVTLFIEGGVHINRYGFDNGASFIEATQLGSDSFHMHPVTFVLSMINYSFNSQFPGFSALFPQLDIDFMALVKKYT